MEIPGELERRVAAFGQASRWERAELGRSLRQRGLSYGEIMAWIPVPKGTLAGWCRELSLTPDQVAAIKRRRGPREGPRDTQWRRRAVVEELRAEARRFAFDHLEDPFWVAGTVLYWGEGAKTQRAFSLANSDPAALRLFIRWTRAYVEPAPTFVLKLNLHAGNDESAARAFWTRELGLTGVTFYRTFIKPEGTGHRKNHLAAGVCQVRMRRAADAAVRVSVWIEVIADTL